MGDEMIHAGICTGTSGTGWWNAMKTSSNFEAQFVPSPVTCSPLDVSCAVGFNWSTAIGARIEKRSMSCGESPESASANSSITYVSDQPFTAPAMIMPSTSQLTGFDLSTPLMPDWNKPLLAQVDQAYYPNMYQEDHTSVKPYFPNQNHMGGDNTAINQALNHPNQNNQFISGQDVSSDSSLPMPFEFPSTILRSLLESSNRPPELPFNHIHPVGFPSNEGFDPSNVNSSHFDKTSTIRQPLHFSNETPFWTTANNMSNNYDLRTSMTGHDNQALKTAQEGSGGGSSSLTKRKTESQSGFKKPRMESTPPPMPTFKVRKEKVGDRISALQQLVSPFGKTDTASVLHETIDYIKFLHDQVDVLSAPYLKNGHQMQHIKNMERIKESNEGTKRDLISRGLCLVPISSTFAVASEVPVDIWAPAFAASFR